MTASRSSPRGRPPVANRDNVETISKVRLTKRLGSLDSHELAQLDAALRHALGIRT